MQRIKIKVLFAKTVSWEMHCSHSGFNCPLQVLLTRELTWAQAEHIAFPVLRGSYFHLSFGASSYCVFSQPLGPPLFAYDLVVSYGLA